MPRERTGTAILDGKRWVAVVTIPGGPRKGERFKCRLPKGTTESEARAEALRLSTDPVEIARLIALPKRRRRRKRVEPKLHGKNGRMLRTESGRTVFHQHVVASLIDKTAREIVKCKRKAEVYERKGCDGSDPIVRVCDVMAALLVGNIPQYIESECE